MQEELQKAHQFYLSEKNFPGKSKEESKQIAIDVFEKHAQETIRHIMSDLNQKSDVKEILKILKNIIFNLRCGLELSQQNSTKLWLAKTYFHYGYIKNKFNLEKAELYFYKADVLCMDYLKEHETQSDNELIDVYRFMAHIKLQREQLDYASTILEKVFSTGNVTENDHLLMGFLLNAKGDGEAALQYLQKINTPSVEALIQIASALKITGDDDETEKNLQDLLKQEENLADIYELLASFRLKENDVFTATLFLEQALNIQPCPSIYDNLSQAYEYIGDFDKALNIHLEKPKRTPSYFSKLAELYYQMQKFPELKQTLTKIKEYKFPIKTHLQVRCLMEEMKFTEALTILETHGEADNFELQHLELLIYQQSNQLQNSNEVIAQVFTFLPTNIMKADIEEAYEYFVLGENQKDSEKNYGKSLILLTQTCFPQQSFLLLIHNLDFLKAIISDNHEEITNIIQNNSQLISEVSDILRTIAIIYFRNQCYDLALDYFTLLDQIAFLSPEEQELVIPYPVKDTVTQIIIFYELCAFYFLMRERMTDAFKFAEKAYHLDKNSYALELLKAWSQEQIGYYDDALRIVESVILKKFSHYTPSSHPILACFYEIQAKCYYKTKRIPQALASIKQGFSFNPNSLILKVLSAHYQLKIQQYETSLKLVTKILKTAPNDVDALNIRAQIYLTMPEKSVSAAKDYLNALNINKTSSPLTLQKLTALYLLTKEGTFLQTAEHPGLENLLSNYGINPITQKAAEEINQTSQEEEKTQENPQQDTKKAAKNLYSTYFFVSPPSRKILGQKRKAATELSLLFESAPKKVAMDIKEGKESASTEPMSFTT